MRGSVVRPPSNDEGLKDIQHSMSMVLDTMGFHILFIMTVYYKMRQLFYYKMRQKFITKCVRFFITKLRQLLKNAMILLQNVAVITKCDVYYKL